jgi:sterol desaturase/sphingolipid hydroxylase (fatty acid hydroxylase superfamily)
MIELIVTKLLEPFTQIIDQRSIFSYAAAVIFVFLAVIVSRLARKKSDFRLRALWRLITKKNVWLHHSAKLDYRMYAVNLVLISFFLGYFTFGMDFWANTFGDLLTRFFGPAYQGKEDNALIFGIVVLLEILAMDFGYWFGHYTMHKSPILWEFHKVHHSAEVMTPATEFRQHPLELIYMPTVIGVTTGLTFAVVSHFFGDGSELFGVTGFCIILVVHMLTFHHLRHSHIHMPFTGVAGHVLHSPMHHIIHHSDNPVHFDRNLGYILSIWDWMAGTLYVPRKNERVTLGIGHEGATHDTIANSFWLPVRNAGRIIVSRWRAKAKPEIEQEV